MFVAEYISDGKRQEVEFSRYEQALMMAAGAADVTSRRTRVLHRSGSGVADHVICIVEPQSMPRIRNGSGGITFEHPTLEEVACPSSKPLALPSALSLHSSSSS